MNIFIFDSLSKAALKSSNLSFNIIISRFLSIIFPIIKFYNMYNSLVSWKSILEKTKSEQKFFYNFSEKFFKFSGFNTEVISSTFL